MEYGKNDKRLSFTDSDKRAAELIIRLKHDGLTKTKFFRSILTGYLDRDPNIVAFIDTIKESEGLQSNIKSRKVKSFENSGLENKKKFGLGQGEIEDIFDILEKEHPEL